MTELTIGNIVYYVIPGGREMLDSHPNECPLILYNKPLEEIMKFGDTWRARGRAPCVILPSPSLGGHYTDAWDNHADPSGLIDNIAAHIDGYIVDFANAETPEFPKVWEQTKDYPIYIFWERQGQEVYFRGSHNQFVNKFKFDPEVTPIPDDSDDTDNPPPGPGEITMHINCPHCGERIF